MTTTFDKINQTLDADMSEKKSEVQWKMVPVEPTDEMIEAAGEAYEFDAEAEDELGFNISVKNTVEVYATMLAAAPVPPAGDVEVYQAGVHFPGKYLPHVKEVVLLEDHHAHVTRLTAERDGLLADIDAEQQDVAAYKYTAQKLTAELAHVREERDSLQRVGIQAQSELTKAREALNYLMERFDSEFVVCDRCSYETETRDMDSAIYLREFLSNQPAPAANSAKNTRCCCSPKGFQGLWAAGPCPVHMGLRAPAAKGEGDE